MLAREDLEIRVITGTLLKSDRMNLGKKKPCASAHKLNKIISRETKERLAI